MAADEEGRIETLVGPVAREDAISYRLLSSRSADAGRTVLDDYRLGASGGNDLPG